MGIQDFELCFHFGRMEMEEMMLVGKSCFCLALFAYLNVMGIILWRLYSHFLTLVEFPFLFFGSVIFMYTQRLMI